MTKRLINLAATLVPVFCCCSTGPSAPPIQAAALASRPASAPASAPAVAASRRASPGIKVISVTPVKGPAFPDKLVRIEYTSPSDGTSDWALALPPKQGQTWVVCIHGHGSTGEQLYTRQDIRRSWLPLFNRHGFGILTPNLRGNAWMSPRAAADLNGLLQYVRERYLVDRFILAGGSMGGTSNLIYAVLHPEDVAGVVALCPAADLTSYYQWCRRQSTVAILQQIADAIASAYGCPPESCPDLYREHSVVVHVHRLTMPVYVAHGGQDTIIPIAQARVLYGEIRFKGVFHFCEIPEGDHDAPLRNMTDGIEWVLKRMR